MSDGFNINFGAMPDGGIIIKTMCGCRLVFGPIPMSEIGMLSHGFSKKAMWATDIADRIGASLVIGEPEDLDELRKMNLPISDMRRADAQAASERSLYGVTDWLRTGERGRSSNAMCKRIFGVPQDAGTDHPHDPADLRRCVFFLDATNAHDKIGYMLDVSPQWSALVSAWDRLVAMLREEMAEGNFAPKTYAMMKEILKES